MAFSIEREAQHLEIVRDQACSLLKREAEYVTTGGTSPCEPPTKHAQWRTRIFEWFYVIIDYFEYDRHVVYISMDYLDRFLLIHPDAEDMKCRIYQLVAMTSLYVAMKIHGGDPNSRAKVNASRKLKRLNLKTFVELSRGQFVEKDIISMELCLLSTLKWLVNPVTPACFLLQFLRMFPRYSSVTPSHAALTASHHPGIQVVMQVLHELSFYLTELAICVPGVSSHFQFDQEQPRNFTPSSIAFASMLLAMDMISYSALPEITRQQFLDSCAYLTLHTDSYQDSYQTSCPGNIGIHLCPHQGHIQYLKNLIQNSFIPDYITNQDLPHEQIERHVEELPPIAMVMQPGLLNQTFFERLLLSITTGSADIKHQHRQPASPTSPLDGP